VLIKVVDSFLFGHKKEFLYGAKKTIRKNKNAQDREEMFF